MAYQVPSNVPGLQMTPGSSVSILMQAAPYKKGTGNGPRCQHDWLFDNSNASRYHFMMIVSFGDSDTQKVFEGKRSRKFPPMLHRHAMRKLWMLNAAFELHDLRVPPGNRLEKLSGTMSEYHSIRINEQWRVRFRWRDGNAYEVLIIDYH